MGYFAGLDVSVKETSVCIVDDAGRIVREVCTADLTLPSASSVWGRACTNLRVCGVYPRHTQRYFRARTRASAGSLQVTRRLSMAVFWGEAAPMPRGSVDHEPSHCRHGVWLHASRMFCNDAQPESRFHEIGSAGRNAGH